MRIVKLARKAYINNRWRAKGEIVSVDKIDDDLVERVIIKPMEELSPKERRELEKQRERKKDKNGKVK